MKENSLQAIVSLCKRRGFVYPASSIYGGFANTYSYGPYGVELKKNIRDLWWKRFVRSREDIVGIDGPILLHPKVWQASGHIDGFSDLLVDCRSCKKRFRADHLLEKEGKDVEGMEPSEVDLLLKEANLACSACGKRDSFTQARPFNLMFQTEMSKTKSDAKKAYLRPETAQAMFIDFKNVVDSTRRRLPFGLAQIGKAFRNEITPGNFLFRLIEFEQMEIEYFLKEEDWKESFQQWLEEMESWCESLGLSKEHIHRQEHASDKLSHYSKRTVDITYDFPFGRSELYGLAYRADFDLTQHAALSNEKLSIRSGNGPPIVPHVIEPTFGLDRTILALLCEAYREEKLDNGSTRTLLSLHPQVAPVKVAVFPLVKKAPFVEKARSIYQRLLKRWNVEIDESGNIGKRYRRQDELGTPYCITVDYDSLEKGIFTLRDRDSMEQKSLSLDSIFSFLDEKIGESI